MARPGLAVAALGFALAALAAAWNPLSAPFGLAVGLTAAGLALRALARPPGRPLALAGLVVGLAAAGLAGLTLARTAGLGRGDPGPALVVQPAPAEVQAALDAAATTTRPARARAAESLDRLSKPVPSN